jgi:hypothetical protein
LALRQAGIAKVNPSHPTLLALIEAGATVAELVAIAPAAKGKQDPFAYLLSVAVGARQRAAEQAKTLHQGALPAAPEQPWRAEQRERTAAFAGRAAAKRQTTKPNPNEVIDGIARIVD